jgi:SAM-dependent methyltransferase
MRLYGRLASMLVDRSPIDLAGCDVLDLGAGTGAVGRAAAGVGARVVAVDAALGMLLAGRASRPPAVVGDALALPFVGRSFDVVVAAFSLSHVEDAAAALREVGRVATRYVLASTYAVESQEHPVRTAVETALTERGWSPPPWYRDVRRAMSGWRTVEACTSAIEQGGLAPVAVEQVDVSFPDLVPLDLVRWRLGMAAAAPFITSAGTGAAEAIERRALELLPPDSGPLARSVLFIVAGVR